MIKEQTMPIAPDMDSVRIPNYYEAAPADYEAIERLLAQTRTTEHLDKSACALTCAFLDTLKSFRRIEFAHTRTGNSNHNEILKGLLDVGKNLRNIVAREDINISESGFTKEDVFANIAYLENRWDIWYGAKDEEKANRFLSLIYSETSANI